jgi:ribosomal protein S18 acetylase RimI-like enzyme
MHAMWQVRRAAAADAVSLHEIAGSTFRETFGPANSAEDMDLHCSRAFTREAQARELVDPAIDTLVIDDDANSDRFAAYAQIRGGTPPPSVRSESPIELQRFYVRSEFHGAGLAKILMDAVLSRAREKRADILWLGVWEKNPRAIRFYEKCGFRQVGDQTFLLGTDPQRDLVLVRRV